VVSTNGSFAARRAAARRGKAAVLSAVAPTEHLPALAPAGMVAEPASAPAPARRLSNAPDLRSPERIAAERAARDAEQAAIAAENPDDIPSVTEEVAAPVASTAPDRAAAADGVEAPPTEGVVVLSLSGLRPGTPHVMRVGAGPLPDWCATRPLGVRWSSGWWTDAGPLPVKAKAAPEGTHRAQFGLPEQAAGRWRELQGQTVGPWAWVLAIGHMGEVLGAFHVPAHRRAALLSALGAGEAGAPSEDDWTLSAGARFGETDPVAEPAAEPAAAAAPEHAPNAVEDWPVEDWPTEELVWDEPEPDFGDQGWAMPVGF
jgi:hypothetical protein